MKPCLWPCLLLLAALTAWAQIPAPTDAPKPLAPEQTVAAFRLPDGFRLEVVASEPLVASPSGVCWDERGRMFVSELHGYNLEGQLDIEELNKTGVLDTQVRRVQADEKFKRAAQSGTYGVVKLLLDTDDDGRMDQAHTWATHLPPAYGLVPARGGVIVACAPDIVFLADRDDDGIAEVQEKLFTGFRTGALERGINAPQWGMDGWIYFGRGWGGGTISGPRLAQPVQLPNSDFRIRSDGSAIEPVTGSTHTFGFAITESGDRFTATTTIPGIYVAPLPWRYLARNPNLATPALEVPTGDRRAYAISKPHPWRQKRAEHPEYFHYYKSRYGAAESEPSGWFTAACSPLVYQDSALPGLHGHYFVCEPAGNLIHRALIEEEGSVRRLRRAPGEERSEFAATTDAWSHPMNLTHGPDGSIWVVDYYREIIEDYSAIPRHLQQQYGLYRGHDRGRIYRLTHRDAPPAPAADMSRLPAQELARECASSLFWRRQTAQRLLVERADARAVAALRALLADSRTAPAAIVTALRTLDQLGALEARDAEPFLVHRASSVRVHALQLADRWFARGNGGALLEHALGSAERETHARVALQLALSLGESADPRAFAALARFARERLNVRWMDVAILSSANGREADLLGELLRPPVAAAEFLSLLAQTLAARRDETELSRALKLLGYAGADVQAAVLRGLASGRKNAPPQMLPDASARAALTNFITSRATHVSEAATALAQTFRERATDDQAAPLAPSAASVERVSEEAFRNFLRALSTPGDSARGHAAFVQACAPCHRIGAEGFDVGPDLLGQIGMGDEALLKDILLPSERIRPGYEATEVRLTDGSVMTGLLKEEAPTSLRLVQAGGMEQSILRKDVAQVRRLATSLMPAFAETLTPAEVANLLAWLRSQGTTPGLSPAPEKRR